MPFIEDHFGNLLLFCGVPGIQLQLFYVNLHSLTLLWSCFCSAVVHALCNLSGM